MTEQNVDAGKLVNKLLARNQDLTLANAVQEVQIEELLELNKTLTEVVQSFQARFETKEETSEEINEIPDGPGAAFGLHDRGEPGDGGGND